MSLAPQPVKTEADGDLKAVIQDSGGTNADVTAHNATAANGLHVLVGRAITAEEAVTTANAGFLSLDPANGRLRVSVENTAAVTVTGTVTVDTGPAEAAGLFVRITDGAGGPVVVDATDTVAAGAGLQVLNARFETTATGGTATRAGMLSLTTGGDLRMTLDSEAVVLGAGSASVGTLGANSGVDIGDVDVTSLPALVAGTALIGKIDVRANDDAADVIAAGSNEVVAGDALQTLPAVCNASSPTQTDTRACGLSVQTDGALRVASSVAAPSNTAHNTATGTAIAAAGTSLLESADPGTSGTRYLTKSILSSTVQGKWELHVKEATIQGAVLATVYTSNVNPSIIFEPPWKEAIPLTLAATADSFQWDFTNLEPGGGDSGDASASFFYES